MLPDFVSADQTAYVKGRNITQNIRIVQDAIEYTKQKKRQKILLFLDFEKAFDSVEHNFIFKTLGKSALLFILVVVDHTPQITDINDINVTKLTVKSFYKTLTEHSDTTNILLFRFGKI